MNWFSPDNRYNLTGLCVYGRGPVVVTRRAPNAIKTNNVVLNIIIIIKCVCVYVNIRVLT